MKIEKFASLLDEFLDILKDGKHLFVDNLNNLEKFKGTDNSFIEWVQMYLKWSEVTTHMSKEYYAGWDEEDEN